MLKFYISTVIIWFVIFIAEAILTHEDVKKMQDKIRKEFEIEKIKVRKYRYIKNTFRYLLISCIPLIRLVVLVIEIYITYDPNVAINLLNNKRNKDE